MNALSFLSFKFCLLIGIFSLFLVAGCSPECTQIDYVAASIEVEPGNRTHIGLNADPDSLNFGKVSPGAVVRRSLTAEYSKTAQVKVSAEGEFSSWINIAPAEFSLPYSEIDTTKKQVYVTVTVPEQAPVQKYFGRVKFCFQELS